VADHFLLIFTLITRHSSLATSVSLGFSARRVLLCLLESNLANITESAQMKPARIE
jgi:hypothetical protein